MYKVVKHSTEAPFFFLQFPDLVIELLFQIGGEASYLFFKAIAQNQIERAVSKASKIDIGVSPLDDIRFHQEVQFLLNFLFIQVEPQLVLDLLRGPAPTTAPPPWRREAPTRNGGCSWTSSATRPACPGKCLSPASSSHRGPVDSDSNQPGDLLGSAANRLCRALPAGADPRPPAHGVPASTGSGFPNESTPPSASPITITTAAAPFGTSVSWRDITPASAPWRSWPPSWTTRW